MTTTSAGQALTKLSLFSGIGGDDLASDWAGIHTICFVEKDKFCQQVLRKHWHDTPIIEDVKDVTKAKVKEVSGYEQIDIVSGGDPCQPRSVAGKRRGREDDRDLWKDMFRVICEFKPAWVINENPTGRLTMDFYEVLSDLESQGYETRSFVIPACAVNAWHRRDRVFIVAYRNGKQINTTNEGGLHAEFSLQDYDVADSERSRSEQGYETARQPFAINRGCNVAIADTKKQGLQRFLASTGQQGEEVRNESTGRCYRAWRYNWIEVATVLCGMADGLPHRVARLKGLGNAVVPQQIYPIYKAIVEIERNFGGTSCQ